MLLSWLERGNNYGEYRHSSTGKSKKVIAGSISSYLQERGVSKDIPKIKTKISRWERQFNEAADWLGQTGEGLT